MLGSREAMARNRAITARAVGTRVATEKSARVRAASATKAARTGRDGLGQGGNQPTRNVMKGFWGCRRFANVGIRDLLGNRGFPNGEIRDFCLNDQQFQNKLFFFFELFAVESRAPGRQSQADQGQRHDQAARAA